MTACAKELMEEVERSVWAPTGLVVRDEVTERFEMGVKSLGDVTAGGVGRGEVYRISGVPLARGEGE